MRACKVLLEAIEFFVCYGESVHVLSFCRESLQVGFMESEFGHRFNMYLCFHVYVYHAGDKRHSVVHTHHVGDVKIAKETSHQFQ